MAKKIWNDVEREVVKAKYSSTPVSELANKLGVSKYQLREFAYSLNVKKYNKEYWTIDQIKFLKEMYKANGDVALAKLLNEKYPKSASFTPAQVEKKRGYLKLIRSSMDLVLIKQKQTLANKNLYKELSENYIVGLLSRKHPELRPIIQQDKRLIVAKRYELAAKRILKDYAYNQAS